MEDAKNVYIPIGPDEVCNPIVTIKQDPDIPFACVIFISALWELTQNLDPIIDFTYNAGSSYGILLSNVLEDILKPLLSLIGPI
jgi:hypothetical protein